MNKKETKQSLVEKNAVLIKENESIISNQLRLRKEISKLLGKEVKEIRNLYETKVVEDSELFSWERICFEIGGLVKVYRETKKDTMQIVSLEKLLIETSIALQTLDKEGSSKHLYEHVQNF